MSSCIDPTTLEAPSAPPCEAEALTRFLEDRLDRVVDLLGERSVLEGTLATMEALAPDPVNGPALLRYLREGILADDGRCEIRSALRALARALQPRSYLEIGTRRGWSLAQVAAECPQVECWSVDLWIPAYGAVSNPGPGFVREELERVAPGFAGRCRYLDGNSHDLLPLLLEEPCAMPRTPGELALLRESEARPRRFDLVTVDGDHTAAGAWWDLCDVMPHVALGGAVVFDDLVDASDERMGDRARCSRPDREAPPADLGHSLLDVWRRIQGRFPNFVYVERLDARPPLGIAIRAQ